MGLAPRQVGTGSQPFGKQFHPTRHRALLQENKYTCSYESSEATPFYLLTLIAKTDQSLESLGLKHIYQIQ